MPAILAAREAGVLRPAGREELARTTQRLQERGQVSNASQARLKNNSVSWRPAGRAFKCRVAPFSLVVFSPCFPYLLHTEKNSLILKVKDIAIFAVKISKFC